MTESRTALILTGGGVPKAIRELLPEPRRNPFPILCGTSMSYLLFERPYTRALIDQGYADTLTRRDEVRQFLDLN